MNHDAFPADLGRQQSPWKVADDARSATVGTNVADYFPLGRGEPGLGARMPPGPSLEWWAFLITMSAL